MNKVNVYVVQNSTNINVELIKLTSYLQKQDNFRVFAVDNLANVQFNTKANNLFLHDRFIPLISEKEFASLINDIVSNDFNWDFALLGKCTTNDIKPNRTSQFVEFDNFFYPLMFRKSIDPIFDAKEVKNLVNSPITNIICLDKNIFSININNDNNATQNIMNTTNNNKTIKNQNKSWLIFLVIFIVILFIVYYYAKNKKAKTLENQPQILLESNSSKKQ